MKVLSWVFVLWSFKYAVWLSSQREKDYGGEDVEIPRRVLEFVFILAFVVLNNQSYKQSFYVLKPVAEYL